MRIVHWLIVIAVAMGVLVAPAAYAQTNLEIERLVAAPGEVDKTPSAWKHIGANPLRVSPEVIGAAHARYTNITQAEILKGVAMQARGECITHQLTDEDVLRNGFGNGESLLTRVAFGQAVPADSSKRTSDVCIIREDGTAIVRPHGCGNWSVAKAILKKPVENTVADVKQSPAPKPKRSYAAKNPTVSTGVSTYNPQPPTVIVIGAGNSGGGCKDGCDDGCGSH